METENLKVHGGQIVRKCTLEHFSGSQWLYGNPYFYLVEYDKKINKTDDDTLVALWRFNTETLQYDLYQTAERKSSKILDEIANKWEKEMWTERLKKQNPDYED